jgi:hypothetical protein
MLRLRRVFTGVPHGAIGSRDAWLESQDEGAPVLSVVKKARRMGATSIDDSRHPLVLVTFHGSLSEPEFDDYLERMSRLLDRHRKNVTVFDARKAKSPTATQRAKQAAWLKTNRVVLEQYSCGSVFVIDSALVRGGLTAILWIAPMPVAHAVVATLEEGERWAFDRLRAAGVPLPPSARATSA